MSGSSMICLNTALAALVLVAVAAVTGDGEQNGPTVPPQWSADMVLSGTSVGMNITNSRGRFYYDSFGQRHRLTYSMNSDLFKPNTSQAYDQLSSTSSGTQLTVGTGADGACMPMPMNFSDMFAWLATARHVRTSSVEGEPCEILTKEISMPMPGQLGMMLMSACIGAGGLPWELNQSLRGKFTSDTSYRFSHHLLVNPGDGAFKPTDSCKHYPAPPCKSTGVAVLDVYRVFGPPEPLELENRDAGDILGDVSFVCTQGSGAFYKSKLITHWSVTVDTSFGQYALCNYNGTVNTCAGPPAQLQHVGRRSSQMSGGGAVMGQCSSNDDVGSQYSFPAAARCPEGVLPGQPGAAGCAWGGAKALRTIRASCVMEERGLLAACAREFGHAPFVESAGIWRAAFESSDPLQGGCPDADAENSMEMEQLVVV